MKIIRCLAIVLFSMAALFLIIHMSEDAEATRTAQTIDLVIYDTIENTTGSAQATLTWLGGGAWDGVVDFSWFDNTDSLVFQESVAPDGIGIAYSNYAPDWLGTWHVNASFTGTNPVYDNESFEVISPSIQVINGITWSDEVSVSVEYHRDITWVGQGQDFRMVATNSSSGDPIQGVEISASILTSDLETVLPTTVLGETNYLGEFYYSFVIPVRAEFEDRFMAVEINIVSVDYTGVNGWMYHSHEPFYCGYFFQFTSDANLTLATGEEYNVYDEVVANVDYMHGYNGSFTGTAFYQIINTTTDQIYSGGEVEYSFSPEVDYDFFPFKLPLGLESGQHRAQGYLRIDVPNTEQVIEIFTRTDSFNITDTKGITFHNVPFPVTIPPNLTVDDTMLIEVNRTFYIQTQQTVSIGFTNIDTGLIFFPTTTTAFTEESGVRIVPYPISRGLISGNYILNGQVSYTVDGIAETVEWETESFYVDAVKAEASSDLDIFQNQTILELDGSDSHGYNDTYYGLRWTNTHEINKTWYGLHPTMVFNETGNYTINLNVTDGAGNYSEDFFLVYVKESNLINNINTVEQNQTQSQDGQDQLQFQNQTIINQTIPTDVYTKVFTFKDSQTGDEINFVTMLIDGEEYDTRIGEISAELQWGVHDIVINAEGYRLYSTSIFVDSDDDYTIPLEELPEEEEQISVYIIALLIIIIIIVAGWAFKKSGNDGTKG